MQKQNKTKIVQVLSIFANLMLTMCLGCRNDPNDEDMVKLVELQTLFVDCVTDLGVSY